MMAATVAASPVVVPPIWVATPAAPDAILDAIVEIDCAINELRDKGRDDGLSVRSRPSALHLKSWTQVRACDPRTDSSDTHSRQPLRRLRSTPTLDHQ